MSDRFMLSTTGPTLVGAPDGEPGRSAPIAAYALIGNGRTAALVSGDGCLDWLCLPRFDSPSVFAALLDDRQGGRFSVRPAGPYRGERRYVDETNVLETTFRTAEGTAVLRDLMPVGSETEKRAELWPEHEVLRELEGVQGTVDFDVVVAPRPEYARRAVRARPRGALGVWWDLGGAALALHADVPLTVSADGASVAGRVRLAAGERRSLSLTYGAVGPAVLPPLGHAARARIERSVDWWQRWAHRCTYEGPYRDRVVRSALALKLMAYAPSGAIVAAPTTSLPEVLGGGRNWDYRYCWLRDAAFTVRALFDVGYAEEAEAFLSWMLHATRLTWPELQVLYDVFGEARVAERELPHLAGYAGSRPVRVGNGAHGQLQLDVYGEVCDAAVRFAHRGGRFDRDTARMLQGLGETVCRRWREPDEGIWEGRSGRFHHTHSKVLCWVALDRLVSLHASGHLRLRHVERFRRERDAIRAEVEARGFDERLGSYVRTFGSAELDASLLTLPLYGYVDAASPRMRGTTARILEALGRDGVVYRLPPEGDDGLGVGHEAEGAFGVCGFWAVECLARAGEQGAATRAFERLLDYANDVGLFAEEMDPWSGSALGNFPQAFTHVGLIDAALTLAEHGGQGAQRGQADAGATMEVDR